MVFTSLLKNVKSNIKLSNIKLIVFDKDGTLIDQNKFFAPMIKNYLEYIKPCISDNIDLNKELGFDPIKMRLRSDSIFAIKNEKEIKNEINKIIFRNTDQANEDSSYALINNNHEFIYNDTNEIESLANISKLFGYLKEKNINITINTLDNLKNTDLMMDKYNLNNYVDEIITSDDIFNPKPDPESINFLSNKFNLPTDNIMIVGDSVTDIQLGKNSKCGATVAVKTGNYLDTEFLNDADYVIDSIDNLYGIF